MTAESGSLCRRWKCELQSTRRSLASHSTKASGMVSIASRSLTSASTVFSARLFCSVMSTAMPIRCRPASAAPWLSSQRTRSQIQWPSVCCMRKVWSMWLSLRGDQLIGDREQVDVVGFHQRVDLAEGQKIAAGVEAEHREHRLRPEDPAARQVPVPQSAAPAIERGIDAAAHGVIDEVAFAGAGRLPVEGKAEDQHDEAGRGRQRHRQRRVRLPERIDPFLDDDDLARQRPDDVRDRQRAAAVRQGDVGDAGLLPGRGQRQRRADDVEDAAGVADPGVDRHAGEDALVGADHDDVPAGRGAPRRNEAGQQQLQALERSPRSWRAEAMRSRRSASTSASAARSRLIEARFCRL